MTSGARGSLVAVLVLAVLISACGSSPSREPEGGTGPGEAGSEPGGGGENGQPENLLEDEERNRLLLDLDRYTEEWQLMREQGRVSAYGGLERLIRRKIDGDVDLTLSIVKQTEDPRGRLIVSKALGFSRDERTEKALIGLLRADDPALLENALMGVSLRPLKMVPVDLIAMLLEHFDYGVQRNAALALRQVVRRGANLEGKARERAMTRLSVMLLDPDHATIRGNAAAALGVIGGEEQEDDLLSLLGDADVYPRIRAIVALARVGTMRSVDPLIQLLAVDEANVRRRASQALWVITKRLGYALDGSVLGEDPAAWRKAIAARQND